MSSKLQAKPVDPVASLQRLSKTVGLHQPSSFKASSPTIILATWMNAAPRNISFYIQRHIDLFPDARIILLQGIIPNMVYLPEATQKAALQPVLGALLAEPESPVFIHLFCNSGAQQTGLLLRAYKEKTGNALPVKGLFFDSAPSIGTFSRAYTGLSYEIPKKPWWIRIPGLVAIVVVIAIVWLIGKSSGRLNVIAQGNHDLLDKSLIDQNAERWYLYSVEDKLVRSSDIEWHAKVAKEKGWIVHCELFDGSPHCRHGKVFEERYWRVIREGVQQKCYS